MKHGARRIALSQRIGAFGILICIDMPIRYKRFSNYGFQLLTYSKDLQGALCD